jgi:hypothetical protein
VTVFTSLGSHVVVYLNFLIPVMLFFSHRYLNDGNFIRVAHALETLAILLREIFKKRFNEQGFTILILVAGSVDNADNFFRRLIMGIVGLLTRDDVPVLVKSLGVK